MFIGRTANKATSIASCSMNAPIFNYLVHIGVQMNSANVKCISGPNARIRLLRVGDIWRSKWHNAGKVDGNENRNRYVHRTFQWSLCTQTLGTLYAILPIQTDYVCIRTPRNRQWKSGKPYISASRTLKIAEKKVSNFVHWMRLQCIRMNCAKPVLQFECVVCTLLCFFFVSLQLCATSFYLIQPIHLHQPLHGFHTHRHRRFSNTIFFNGLKVKQCMICYLYAPCADTTTVTEAIESFVRRFACREGVSFRAEHQV